MTLLNSTQGRSLITANNDLAGRDPVFGVPKSLSLVIVRNGRREESVVPEDATYDWVTGSTLSEASLSATAILCSP